MSTAAPPSAVLRRPATVTVAVVALVVCAAGDLIAAGTAAVGQHPVDLSGPGSVHGAVVPYAVLGAVLLGLAPALARGAALGRALSTLTMLVRILLGLAAVALWGTGQLALDGELVVTSVAVLVLLWNARANAYFLS